MIEYKLFYLSIQKEYKIICQNILERIEIYYFFVIYNIKLIIIAYKN